MLIVREALGRPLVMESRPAGRSDRAELDRQLTTVYRAECLPLKRLALLLTGSDQVAEEIVQEAFIRLHQSWDTVRSSEGFLRTVVANLARNHCRRVRVEQRHLPQPPSAVAPPEFDDTWTALLRLPFRQRAVIVLRYYEDLSEAQVAELLNCQIGTVKSAHSRALERLKKELAE
jgi:RNA polymerase sigma-70 factor (sigma-E family)